ncbi:MAG: hypothetical protein ACRDV7_01835, partial [Acidimicrobiia bacterium]
MTDVHDRASGRAVGVRSAGAGTHEEPGDGLDGPLRRGQADPLWLFPEEMGQSLERESQVRST